MAIFTRQFSTMIDAGLPLVQCLTILAEQSESTNLREVTGRVARTVEQGSTLADALRRNREPSTTSSPPRRGWGDGWYPRHRLPAPGRLHREAAALKRKVKSP